MNAVIHADPLEVAPLTVERWDDLTQLFGERGASSGCWCMYWRAPRKEFQAAGAAGHRQALYALLEEGVVPGVLAYLEGRPVGWCSLGPREDFLPLENSRLLKRLDDRPVWSIVCFFVAPSARRHGLMLPLLRGALEYARRQGAQTVEAYPRVDDQFNAAESYMGRVSVLEQAGFREAASPSEKRRVMRCEIIV